MRIRIVGSTLPGRNCAGYTDIEVGVQVRTDVVDLFPGDASGASWEVEVSATLRDGRWIVRGPAIHGRGDERFLYLSWQGRQDGVVAMFRRAKLQLDAVPPEVLAAASAGTLVGALSLTDARGHPICASVRPPRIAWSAG
jgi:hypothetical protein